MHASSTGRATLHAGLRCVPSGIDPCTGKSTFYALRQKGKGRRSCRGDCVVVVYHTRAMAL
jgi:hypothetical protein